MYRWLIRLLTPPRRLVDLDGIKSIPCDPRFTMTVKGQSGSHTPVKKGTIQKKSKQVQEAEERIHPEGLDQVISRKTTDPAFRH